MTLATRHIGTCAVCEHHQKVINDKMVHHGYKRPGVGSIIGDCFGVGWEPYEISCSATKAYQALVQREIPPQEKILHDLQYKNVSIERWEPDYSVKLAYGKGRPRKLVTYHPGDEESYVLGRQHPSYEMVKKGAITETLNRLDSLREEVARLQRMIDRWEPADVTKVQELVLRQQQGERDAKRAAKEAIAAEKQAKKSELYEKRTANAIKHRAKAVAQRAKLQPELDRELLTLTPEITAWLANQEQFKGARRSKLEFIQANLRQSDEGEPKPGYGGQPPGPGDYADWVRDMERAISIIRQYVADYRYTVLKQRD